MSKERTEKRIRELLIREFGENVPPAMIAVIRATLSLGRFNRSGTASDNTVDRIARPLNIRCTTVKKKNFKDEVYDCPRYVGNGKTCDAYGGPAVDGSFTGLDSDPLSDFE